MYEMLYINTLELRYINFDYLPKLYVYVVLYVGGHLPCKVSPIMKPEKMDHHQYDSLSKCLEIRYTVQ